MEGVVGWVSYHGPGPGVRFVRGGVEIPLVMPGYTHNAARVSIKVKCSRAALAMQATPRSIIHIAQCTHICGHTPGAEYGLRPTYRS